MKIKPFIEKAIEGGWISRLTKDYKDWYLNSAGNFVLKDIETGADLMVIDIHEILLDPKAWEAVGKVEGWDDVLCLECNEWVVLWGECDCDTDEITPRPQKRVIYNMHQMIDALCEGKTVEEYIKTL